ncbi:MAG: ATP-binding cassette domain-containing protein [Christensenellales bacterium]
MRAIEATGISKAFGATQALAGVDLAVDPGEILCLLGANGAGKTTMIRILTTLLRPDAGEIIIHGVDARRAPARARAMFSLTGQFAAVDEMLTGRENLMLIARLLHMKKPRAIADELLERFSLTAAANRRAGAYSGGMRRRLDIAMGLVSRPKVMFMDEPTAGLDPESRLKLWDIVRALRADGAAVLLTTQHLEEADMLADAVAVLAGGKIVAQGTAQSLKARFARGSIEVGFRDAACCAAACERLAGFDMRADGARLIIYTDGGAQMSGEALRALADAGVVYFDVRRASLEDAFLNIIGA